MFKIYYVLTYPITLVFLALIGFYRLILTKGKQKSCHFIPTCSAYAYLSIKEFGCIVGLVLAIKRLLKCRPSHTAGFDYPKLNLLGNYKWKC